MAQAPSPFSRHVVVGILYETLCGAGFIASAVLAARGILASSSLRDRGLAASLLVAGATAAAASLFAAFRHGRFVSSFVPAIRRTGPGYFVWLAVSLALGWAMLRGIAIGRIAGASIAATTAAYLFGISFHVIPALCIGDHQIVDALGRRRNLSDLTRVEIGPAEGDPSRAAIHLAAPGWDWTGRVVGGQRETFAKRLRSRAVSQ